jgi:hypothetical protein
LVCVVSVGIASPLLAADHSLVRFDGGIGVIPVSNVTVNADGSFKAVSPNVVRTVTPPGQIWVIDRLKADVETDGHITVAGRGLLLGGGSGIGTNANQHVFATLICEAAAPFTLHSTTTTGVALAANGDFRIDDFLTPAVPDACASPVLLIRNTGGAWFAAGIVKLE